MSKGKMLVVSAIWIVLIGVAALVYKWWIVPSQQEAARIAEAEAHNKVLTETGADSRYDYQINVALDSFSGYAILRSSEFADELAAKRIKLNLVDDGADYQQRLKSLKDGEVQIAAFTVDALIKTCSETGELPGTIIAVIDETRGADAMVAYKSAIPNLDSLNHKDTKFVLTPDSPSETLARVVMAHFNLTNLSGDPFIKAKDAQEVYKKYRNAKPDEHQVFVLWQPYVSKVLENPNTHVVVDSSRFRGYIVDILVANRDFLYANKDVVQAFVESYFRANYYNHDKMIDLVLEDAKKSGTPLTDKQAEDLVNGVWWKNTQENYSHFGVQRGNLQHIEDIIANITKVLLKTKGITSDPTKGKPNVLYYPGILEAMQKSGFHPGVERVRDDKVILAALTDQQWKSLEPVGTLEIPSLVFARGTARLLDSSESTLDDLVKTLNTTPQYYLLIKGDATRRGDLEANKALALARAQAAADYLTTKGIDKNRLKAIAVEPTGRTSVDFVLGQLPY